MLGSLRETNYQCARSSRLYARRRGHLLLGTSRTDPLIIYSRSRVQNLYIGHKVIDAVRQFLEEIGFTQDNPTLIYDDNQAAIAMSKHLVQGLLVT